MEFIYLLIALIFGGLMLRQQVVLAKKTYNFDWVKSEAGSRSVAEAVRKGYREISRVTGKPFYVRYWQKDYLILPTKYLPDVRRASRDHLSFVDSISDVLFLYNWVGDLFRSSRLVFAVIKGVNSQLPKLSPPMFEEAALAFDKNIGLKDGESGSFTALTTITAISLQTMVRVIAGKELSQNDTFLNATLAYFDGNFLTGFIMLKMPLRGWFRDMVAWPLYKYHEYFRQKRLIKMIKPIIAKRIEDHDLGVRDKEENDTIQCSLNILHEFPLVKNAREGPLDTLAHETLQLVWAGGQSPALSTTTVLYKLLEEPSYIEPLREEAQVAVGEYGWTDAIFNHLPKLDSFIRETHRLHSSFSINATRVVRDTPLTFSDGLTLPPGTRFGFAAEQSQRDPDFITDPETFDGFRFVKLIAADARQEDGVGRWAASHASFSNLTFGYGNHACPGRFIAIRLIKILICKFLLEYDFSWDRKNEEPPRFCFEGLSFPNIEQKVTLWKRPSPKVGV